MYMKRKTQKFTSALAFLCIITVVIVSVANKLNYLNQFSLDFDEIYSIVSSYSSYSSMILGIRYDPGNPPLYFMLLKFWRSFFGQSETVVRLLSVLFHAITLSVIALLSRKKLSITATACVLILLAGSGTLYFFSRYARAYALVIFLSVTVFYLITSWVEQKRFLSWRLFFLCILSAVGLYSHYSFAIFYAELLFILFVFALPFKTKVWRLVLLTVILGWTYLPWATFFIRNQIVPALGWQKYSFHQLKDDWIGVIGWANALTNNVFNVIVRPEYRMVLAYTWILFIDVVLFLTLVINFRNSWKRYVLSFSLISLNLILFTPLHNVLTDVRYALYLFPFLFLSLGIVIDNLSHNALKIGAVIMLIIASIASYPLYDKGPQEDWRGLAHAIPQNSNRIFLFHPCYLGFSFRYYSRDTAPFYCLYENPEKMYLEIWDGSLSNTIYIITQTHNANPMVESIIKKLHTDFSEQRTDFGSIELITLRRNMSIYVSSLGR